MKTLIKSIGLLIGITFMACTFTPNQSKEDQTGTEFSSAYICPMHCDGSGSSEAGNCPVCKMDYVQNPDSVNNTLQEKNMHKDYACPMHHEIHGESGDSCTICGMALEIHQH